MWTTTTYWQSIENNSKNKSEKWVEHNIDDFAKITKNIRSIYVIFLRMIIFCSSIAFHSHSNNIILLIRMITSRNESDKNRLKWVGSMFRFETDPNRKSRTRIIQFRFGSISTHFEPSWNQQKRYLWDAQLINIYICISYTLHARAMKILFFAKIIELDRSFQKLLEFCKSNENWAQLLALKLRRMLKLFAIQCSWCSHLLTYSF